MKTKVLVILSLSAFLLMVGCGGKANTNTNANVAVVTTPTAVPKTSETAAVDTAGATKIENALKAKGFTTVTVDASTTPATLRGTYPKGKLAEVVAAAQEAAGKPVKNEMAEAK